MLQKAASLEELMVALTEMQHPNHVRICANSPAVHELVLENPDLFIAFFSRDNIKAIIHQAAKRGNLALATCLIDKIKLNVLEEKVASPNGSYTDYRNGTYTFHIELLVDNGATMSSLNKLHAVRDGRVDIIEQLIIDAIALF